MTIPIQDFDPNDPDSFQAPLVVDTNGRLLYTPKLDRLIGAARAFRAKVSNVASQEACFLIVTRAPKAIEELYAAAMALEDE